MEAAIISEVTRVASPDSPLPYAPQLEAAFLPGVYTVAAAARKLVEY